MNERNTLKELMAFFGENVPCPASEFSKFWQSNTDEQKEYYLTANLA